MTTADPEGQFALIATFRYDPVLLEHPINSKFAVSSRGKTPYYLLSYHYDRLIAGAKYFGWPLSKELHSLSDFEDALYKSLEDPDEKRPLRCRVTYSLNRKSPTLTVKHAPLPPNTSTILTTLFPSSLSALPPSPSYTVHVNPHGTTTSLHSYFKTTSRGIYDSARQRIDPDGDPPEEIILHDLQGRITEASAMTVYLHRGGRWITPTSRNAEDIQAVKSEISWIGGQAGMTRRWALERPQEDGGPLCVEGYVSVQSLEDGEEVVLSNAVRGFVRGKVVLREVHEQKAES